MIGTLLKYSIGSLLYGGLVTLISMTFIILLMKGWYKDRAFKPISFVLLGILSIIVLWNSTKICGALKIKSDVSSAQSLIEHAIEEISGEYIISDNHLSDYLQSNDSFQEAISLYPLLNYCVDYFDLSSVQSIAELPSTACNAIKNKLDKLIVNALIWLLAFVAAGGIVVVKTMEPDSHFKAVPFRHNRSFDDF